MTPDQIHEANALLRKMSALKSELWYFENMSNISITVDVSGSYVYPVSRCRLGNVDHATEEETRAAWVAFLTKDALIKTWTGAIDKIRQELIGMGVRFE